MMPHYLVFSLHASLGAMGELAGHERRGGLLWPGRSALIGLMGAALGLRRDGDFSALDGLEIDVAIFDSGAPMRDYHTFETVPSAAAKKPNSRPEALLTARGKTNTAITLRDYRAGVFYGVAVQGEGLERLAQALREPHFTLYFGRKSCPLAAPTGARVVQAETVEAAFSYLTVPLWRRGAVASRLVTAGQGETVNDVPLDRARWHFGARDVTVRRVSIQAGG